jgi:DnaB-like helicase N terminal domain
MRTGLASHKQYLEECVLGAVMLEGTAYDAIRFLKSSNFGTYNTIHNSMIFEAIQDLVPCSVIDLATVNNKLMTKYNVNYSYVLSGYTSRVSASANVSYHALMLLQLDLTIKFENLIGTIMKNSTLVPYQVMHLQSEVLSDSLIYEDIFLAITATCKMMEKHDYPEWAVGLVKEFEKNIDIRAKQVAKENKVAAIFMNLEKLSHNLTDDAKQAMKGLAAITKTIFETGVVEPQWKDVLMNSQN